MGLFKKEKTEPIEKGFFASGTILMAGEKQETHDSPFEGECIVPNFCSKTYTSLEECKKKYRQEMVCFIANRYESGIYEVDIFFSEYNGNGYGLLNREWLNLSVIAEDDGNFSIEITAEGES